jgi:hypothetical protein
MQASIQKRREEAVLVRLLPRPPPYHYSPPLLCPSSYLGISTMQNATILEIRNRQRYC